MLSTFSSASLKFQKSMFKGHTGCMTPFAGVYYQSDQSVGLSPTRHLLTTHCARCTVKFLRPVESSWWPCTVPPILFSFLHVLFCVISFSSSLSPHPCAKSPSSSFPILSRLGLNHRNVVAIIIT
ncbi:hypothetical protein CPB86DRAFT_343736 [Serendipita vermifera]|nr:hypothetical protein CPB86DRAFT_343736 [Serendipita vermifera]